MRKLMEAIEKIDEMPPRKTRQMTRAAPPKKRPAKAGGGIKVPVLAFDRDGDGDIWDDGGFTTIPANKVGSLISLMLHAIVYGEENADEAFEALENLGITVQPEQEPDDYL